MDASKDSMEEATFAYLMHRTVSGSRELTPTHMCELIDKYVRPAKLHLRSVSLPKIGDQVTSHITRSELPENFRDQKALKVYSIGVEAWTDIDTVESWFIDRDGRWYWIKYSAHGAGADCSIVTTQHLVNRVSENDRVSVSVLSKICEAFRFTFDHAAQRARMLADDLIKAAAALDRGISISGITPPSD